jgi:hypothetical protein
MTFLDALDSAVTTAGTVYGQVSGKDAASAAAKQAAANEAARARAAAAAGEDKTKVFAIGAGVVALILIVVLLFKKWTVKNQTITLILAIAGIGGLAWYLGRRDATDETTLAPGGGKTLASALAETPPKSLIETLAGLLGASNPANPAPASASPVLTTASAPATAPQTTILDTYNRLIGRDGQQKPAYTRWTMGTDFAASLSASGSATSGFDQSGAFQNAFGDQIVGGSKPLPSWFPLAALGMVAAVLIVWLLRR